MQNQVCFCNCKFLLSQESGMTSGISNLPIRTMHRTTCCCFVIQLPFVIENCHLHPPHVPKWTHSVSLASQNTNENSPQLPREIFCFSLWFWYLQYLPNSIGNKTTMLFTLVMPFPQQPLLLFLLSRKQEDFWCSWRKDSREFGVRSRRCNLLSILHTPFHTPFLHSHSN